MSTVFENVICSFCGCLCDDISVEVDQGRIVKVKRTCANGKGLFTAYDPSPRKPLVDGEEVEWDDAIEEAARILNQSSSPLIYGLSSTATEAQRKIVALADQLGAIIDTTSSVCHGPTGLAMQTVGEPTCTLGEVRDRADLLVFWGCNPQVAHVRHFTRYSATPKGRLTPNGRQDRTIVVVDVRPTASTNKADIFLQVQVGTDYEVISALRSLVKGNEIPVETVGGVPVTQLQEVAERMMSCRYGVMFSGMGLTHTLGRDINVAELFTLVSELNQYTRFTAIPMRGHGNVTGADQVMTWQTGYPFAVSFARGYPQYGPGEFTAVDVLARGEADAAVIVASDPVAHFPRIAARQLENIPTIVLDPVPSLTTNIAHVFFPTASYGVDAAGTKYRMDGIPLRLRCLIPAANPTDEAVVDRIRELVSPV